MKTNLKHKDVHLKYGIKTIEEEKKKKSKVITRGH